MSATVERSRKGRQTAANGPRIDSVDVLVSTQRSTERNAPQGKLEFTLHGWSLHLGMEDRTLEKKLLNAGLNIVPLATYSLRQIIAAMLGDKYVQEVRNLKADADRKEREEKEARAELVKFEDVLKMNVEFLIEPSVRMVKDGVAAGSIKSEWAEQYFRLMREGLPKPERNGK
jgi:hypothetical protein